MSNKPPRSPHNEIIQKYYAMRSAEPKPNILTSDPSGPRSYPFDQQPRRKLIRPDPVPAAEPGFYVVPRSMSTYDFYHGLFDDMPSSALRKFSTLNPNLESTVKAGTLIVLSDPENTSCTYAESQLMLAAQEVKVALEPLTPDEADFMHRHAAEIASFTGQTSTWLGVSAAVLEKHLDKLRDTLKNIESLHQNSYRQHGHLKSAEFFAERKRMLTQLDAHLLNSTRLRGQTTLGDHPKLKTALGISSRSLVHHWDHAGAPKQIPGYATHVQSISRAAKYMKAGGYIGIGIGGVSGLLAIREVCKADGGEPCRKVRYMEGGKFVGSAGLGYFGGEFAFAASPTVCAALGATTGIGGVIGAAVVVGAGAWAGTTVGGMGGESAGEFLYEKNQQ
jgi:hypothetical protein